MLKSMTWRVLLVIVLLYLASGKGEAQGLDAGYERAIDGKKAIRVGWCLFEKGEFRIFVEGAYLAPHGSFAREFCYVIAREDDKSENPLWLLLLDDQSAPKEIIQWTDPAEYKSVWKKQEAIQIFGRRIRD
ncbi:MAG: hypothetical protein HY432_03055 [Candidatus Liptonbacteria bacterium]|nr:hypothetical protein [Candidatus Liptonbacteria bacterium]